MVWSGALPPCLWGAAGHAGVWDGSISYCSLFQGWISDWPIRIQELIHPSNTQTEGCLVPFHWGCPHKPANSVTVQEQERRALLWITYCSQTILSLRPVDTNEKRPLSVISLVCCWLEAVIISTTCHLVVNLGRVLGFDLYWNECWNSPGTTLNVVWPELRANIVQFCPFIVK